MLLTGSNLVSQLAGWRVCVLNRQTGRPADWKTRSGITLIEVMVSISILSIGLVLILQGFTHCLNGLRISENNLKASLLAGNKMAQAQIEAKEDWNTFEGGLSQRFKDQRLKCAWNIETDPVKWESEEKASEIYDDLNEIRASFAWEEGRRKGTISLVTYMRSPPEHD